MAKPKAKRAPRPKEIALTELQEQVISDQLMFNAPPGLTPAQVRRAIRAMRPGSVVLGKLRGTRAAVRMKRDRPYGARVNFSRKSVQRAASIGDPRPLPKCRLQRGG